MKKPLIVLCVLLVPALAFAQPAGSGSAPAPAGSGSAPSEPAPPPPPPTPPAPTTDAAALRKTCADAMNADPSFAEAIVQNAYDVVGQKCELVDAAAAKRRLALDSEQHEKAAAAIAKNEKHVIMAYAAMWIIAAAFVLFLWRRQQLLRMEIAQLKADLDAATKDSK